MVSIPTTTDLVITTVISQVCKFTTYLSLSLSLYCHGEAGTASETETWDAESSFDMAT